MNRLSRNAADLELRGGHHLRLHATDLANDSDEVLVQGPLREVMAPEPEGVHLSPQSSAATAGLAFNSSVEEPAAARD